MPCGGSKNQTVDTETESRHSEMKELEKNYKAYETAIQDTIKSYRKLLQCFDDVGQALANMSNSTDSTVRAPIRSFAEGMSEMKDKGAFATYVSEMTQSMNTNFSDVKEQLKSAKSGFTTMKNAQKSYDKSRSALTKKESDYTKKGKVIEDSGEYPKLIAARDDSKKAYEDARQGFQAQGETLKTRLEAALIESLNEFTHSTANFSGYLEATMNGYRTDNDEDKKPTKMDHARAMAESQSVSRRAAQANMAGKSRKQSSLIGGTDANSYSHPDNGNYSGNYNSNYNVNGNGGAPNPLQTDITPGYPSEAPTPQNGGQHPIKTAAPLPDEESTNPRSRNNSDPGYNSNAPGYSYHTEGGESAGMPPSNQDVAGAQQVPSQYP